LEQDFLLEAHTGMGLEAAAAEWARSPEAERTTQAESSVFKGTLTLKLAAFVDNRGAIG
jgi:hypothetical protein